MEGPGVGFRFRGRCGCQPVLLSDCEAGVRGVVVDNTGTRAMEMGFFPGAAVEVLNNVPGAVSLVVLAGECRFVVSREIAKTVAVRRLGSGWRLRGRGKC